VEENRQHRDGRHEVVFDSWEGRPLGSANFAYGDGAGRMWATISIRTIPRSDAVHNHVPEGYVLCRRDGA